MADIKITDLAAYTDPVSTDVLPIVDVGNDLTKKVSIADLLENAGTGSAAAPSFSFDGDSDTGIYRPGANQVALTAGGTQALLAESTGITIPGNLTVSGTTTTVDTVNLTVKDKNIELGVVSTPSNTTADGGGITLKGATDKTINWVNSTGCWTFNQPTNFNDHVRIDSSGNVGIGLSSPTAPLHIHDSSTATTIRLTNSTSGTSTSDGLIIQESGNHAYIWNKENSFISFGTNNAEKMRIDSSGRLLVGTSTARSNFFNSTATRPFQVETADNTAGLSLTRNSNANGGPGIVLASSAGAALGSNTLVSATQDLGSITFQGNDGAEFVVGAEIKAKVDGTPGANDMPTRLVFSTTADGASSPTERLRIDSSGNVGIGTTSPGRVLEIKNAAPIIRLTDTDDNYSEISANTSVLSLRADESNGAANTRIDFKVDGTERMRIDSSGNVGIGTTSPTTPLQVHSSTTASTIRITNPTSGATSSDGLIIQENGNDAYIWNKENSFISLGTNNVERLRIDSSGRCWDWNNVA